MVQLVHSRSLFSGPNIEETDGTPRGTFSGCHRGMKSRLAFHGMQREPRIAAFEPAHEML
jgi:hypothetical protein